MTLEWAIKIGGVMAALCVLAFPLWALGIPGINDSKNDFVRGWKMGLVAIVLYPLAYLGFLFTHSVVKNRAVSLQQPNWEHTSKTIFLVLLGVFIVRLSYAFYLIARNEAKHKAKK